MSGYDINALGQKNNSRAKSPSPRSDGAQGIQELMLAHSDLEFGNLLGAGGFGEVFRGRWHFNDVAIKVLSNKKFTAAALEEFRREAAIMARMRSDYIVQLRGYCESPSYCLVMEYMPVGSLYDVLHNDQELPWYLRLRIGLDMSYGLAQLHHVNILHRDLKSLNVLLYEAGGLLRARLADFGLSRMKTESNSLSTASSKSVGTLAWMAPELLSLKPKYSVQSDMYSYGMVLWELAEREVSFAGAHPNVLHNEIVAGRAREEFSQEVIDSRPQYISLAESCWSGVGKRPTANEAVKLMEGLFETEMKTLGESKPTLGSPLAGVGAFSGLVSNVSSASRVLGASHSGLQDNLASQSPSSALPASALSPQVLEATKELERLELAAAERRLAEAKQRLEGEQLEAEVRQLEDAQRLRGLAAKRSALLKQQQEEEAQAREEQVRQEQVRQAAMRRQKEQEEAQALAKQERIKASWVSKLDPKTNKLYYTNTVTQATSPTVPEGYKPEGAALEAEQEASRRAAYTRDSEKRAAEAALREAKDSKEVEVLLNYVAQGEQDKAEALLKVNPGLALYKGTVTDLSKRTFRGITAFQYALWALDWHMWTMLLKYLPEQAAAAQYQALELQGTAHGKQVSWQGLIDAYTGYMPLATAASAAGWSGVAYEALQRHWIHQIGGSQLLLPAHVVNEYCHASRAFYPLPDFGSRYELTRSRMSGGVDWYDVRCGKEWANYRGSGTHAYYNAYDIARVVGVRQAEYDKGAVASLLEMRQRQLAALGKTLSGALAGPNRSPV